MAPTNSVVDDARALVERRLAELNEERERLERALAELGGKITRRSPGRPRGRKAAAATAAAPSRATGTGRKKRRGRLGADSGGLKSSLVISDF